MADDRKVVIVSKRAICGMHDKLKNEVHQIVEKKPWSLEKKEEFKKKLLELYVEAVEQTTKSNVSVGGQDWDSVSHSEASSSTSHDEEMEPLNKEKLAEVFEVSSELEDLIRNTTSKRKKYPPCIVEEVSKVLQCQKKKLEKYEPSIKDDSSLSGSRDSCPDLNECIQMLQATSSDIAQLSKSFPELHSKASRLQQAIQFHNAMQECETDAVLFAKENRTNEQSLSSELLTSTEHQKNENELPLGFWWGLPKRKSNPPQRFDATENTYWR